ncbi:MAG: efflux RND transporter permease subunit [Acidobacteria bacterium]|nr:efflux RND transporter permease subunit [Acidobacteriota bacterium]
MRGEKLGLSGSIAHYFINSKLTPLLLVFSLLLGLFAVLITPREEEPQIVVPMIDVMVQYPGAGPAQVESKVTEPVEKLMWDIPGVEYVYSISGSSFSLVTVRFYVGENAEDSLVKVMDKLQSNYDAIPKGISFPLIRQKSIDDVPQTAVTLYSDHYTAYDLRRIAVELANKINRIRNISTVKVIGGESRSLQVIPDPIKMKMKNISPLQIADMLTKRHWQLPAGQFQNSNRSYVVQAGQFISSVQELENLVVGVYMRKPVLLKDVAKVKDGATDPTNYVFFGAGPSALKKGIDDYSTYLSPAVTISIAKRKGSNSVDVVAAVKRMVNESKGYIIPADVHTAITRDYGKTAQDKSNELILHILVATIAITIFIGFTLGIKEAITLFIAVPVTLSLTLFASYFFGYTLNRVSLFALIFAIGILVDDAIVVVENIHRHFVLHHGKGKLLDIAAKAVDEVGNPTILATFTVIAALLPLAFVSGMMGPYMRPIPINASAAMLFSLFIAFTVTPWLAYHLLKYEKHDEDKPEGGETSGWMYRKYKKFMETLIDRPSRRWAFLSLVIVLLLGSIALFVTKHAIVKMLPYDNKSEMQIIIDMPEASTLEQTTATARDISNYLRTVPEVSDFQIYSGTSAPFNFNGLVRHYFMRQGENVADIQVNFVSKDARKRKSHKLAKEMRPSILEIGRKHNANVKVTEIPPGPPVMSTLLAEIYGPNYQRQIEIAKQIKDIFNTTEGVTDVDWYVQSDQKKLSLIPDAVKAAVHGISVEQITKTLAVVEHGMHIGLADIPHEREDVCINLRLSQADRSTIRDLKDIYVHAANGRMIPLSELVKVEQTVDPKWVYHKNLLPVVYVTGEVSGREESPVYAILKMKKKIAQLKLPEGYSLNQRFTDEPFVDKKYQMKWDGEWQITYEVFRDMGIAFAAVMVLIYFLVVGWFRSFLTPFVIMAPIPLTLVGIVPGHWITHTFFTATSMIGFIALSGIIVRNSILLVDFTEIRLVDGASMKEAVIEAGIIRFRPIVLTAAALIVDGFVIIMDPIFEGLAVSLIFGVILSTILTLFVIPLLYFMFHKNHVEQIIENRRNS